MLFWATAGRSARRRAQGAYAASGCLHVLVVLLAFRRREPFSCPLADGFDDRPQRPALLSQMILDAHRPIGDDASHDNTFRLQLFETFGEHAVAEARDCVGQIAEPGQPHQKGSENRTSPTTADQLYGPME